MKLLRYILLAVVFVVVGSSLMFGQLLTEQFDYTAHATNGLAIQSALWNRLNTGDSILVTSGSLTYTGITTSGNKIAFDGTGSDAWRAFTSQTTGTVYYSFLLKVTSLGSLNTTGGYFTGFIQDASTSNFGATVWLRSDGGTGFNIGVNPRTTAANTAWVTGSKSVGTTYLVVVSYSIVASTANDVVKIWIDPALGIGSEPTADNSATNTGGTDLTSVARVFLRQDAATTTPFIEMDEITVTTSWPTETMPVELVSFYAIAKGKNVELAWQTATETNNAGFEIQKSVSSNQSSEKSWTSIGFVEGAGTSNAVKNYSFTDAATAGKYSYRLKQIDRSGEFKYSNVVEVEVNAVAQNFGLTQNYPNPFNPSTKISFALNTSEHATVAIYNMVGQQVATLFNGIANANQQYTLSFDAKNLPSGIYFYSLKSASRSEVKKMTLMK